MLTVSLRKNLLGKGFFPLVEADPSNVLVEVEVLVFNEPKKIRELTGMAKANTIYPFTRQYPEHPRGRTAVSRRAPARRSP